MMSTRQILHRSAGLALLLLTLVPSSGAARTDFPPPPDAKTVWVASSTVWNGIPMSVRRFDTPEPVDAVVEFYRREWERGDGDTPGYREADQPPWTIVSRVERGRLMTVQARPDGRGGATGYLATSDLPELLEEGTFPEGGPGSFPSMRGSEVRDRLVTDDPGKRGETLLISNDYSVGANATFYRGHYEGLGWHKRSDSDAGRWHVLSFAKGNREHNLVIQSAAKGSGTEVVVNTVRKEAW